MLANPVNAFATQDWRIQSFETVYNINPSADGSMGISESINVYFDVQKHGIFRDIPTYYDQGLLKPGVNLKVDISKVFDANDGATHNYVESRNGDYLNLKIGDPNEYVSGEVNYTINYSTQNTVRFFEDHDELYWDVNGTNWPVSAGLVEATVNMSSEIFNAITETACYTGAIGSQSTDCKVTLDPENNSVSISSDRQLFNFENLSYVIAFEKGTFTPPSFVEQWGGFIMKNIGILLPLPVFWLAFRYWSKRGRDPKNNRSIVAQYDAPDDLRAAEVGTVADYTADNRDISATIIDLAIRGYITIEDTTKREKTKNRKYIFHLKNADTSKLKTYEKTLLTGIFSKYEVGEQVKLDSLKNKFYTTSAKVKNELYSSLVDGGYFAAHPKTTMNTMRAMGTVLVVLGLFSIGPTEARLLGWSLGLALSGAIIFGFGALMSKRTVKGVEAAQHSEGMKIYMELAEKDRMNVMQSAGSRYIGDVTSPTFKVELFERLLPFAVALSVEKTWAKGFDDIYSEPPEWYNGNWNTFNTVYMVNALSNGVNTMNTTLTSSPSSSSSSGVGGGGFSGGGFGGGGGGSW